jgi:tetratricopeptide (TPR) repeat protein
VKILFLSANPVDRVSTLRIEQELRELKTRIGGSPYGRNIELVSELSLRPGDLQSVLLNHKPDIVHFSGHCTEKEGIVLEDDAGLSKVVSPRALSELFRILKGNVRLVVLNACYARDQAEALTQTIDCAIGMNAAIEDNAAIIFARHFYQSLAYGCSIQESFELARNQLEIQGIDGVHIPQLLVRDGAQISDIAFVKRWDTSITGLLFWPVACAVLIFVSDVSRRFLSGYGHWPDTIALIVVIVSCLIAVVSLFLSVTTLMRFSNHSVERFARFVSFQEARKPKRATHLAGLMLLLAFGFWISLPLVAKYFNKRGTNLERAEPNKPELARDSYRLALRLDPTYAQAHYNLASTLERVQPNEAIDEYSLAIKHDRNIYDSYSKLSRLYILRGKDQDYESALAILDQGLQTTPPVDDLQYQLQRNFGWANYVLKRYSVAEPYLRKAISFRNGRYPGAHCLLAFVLKAEGKAGVAEECLACVSSTSNEEDLEPGWIRDAKSYLQSSKKTVDSKPKAKAPPAGATAECEDNTFSYSSHRRGACSNHGGVKRWLR